MTSRGIDDTMAEVAVVLERRVAIFRQPRSRTVHSGVFVKLARC